MSPPTRHRAQASASDAPRDWAPPENRAGCQSNSRDGSVAARDEKGQQAQGVISAHGFDPFKSPSLGVERIPNVFLKSHAAGPAGGSPALNDGFLPPTARSNAGPDRWPAGPPVAFSIF